MKKLIVPGTSVCRKKKNDYCVCVCCTVFDTTRPLGVVVSKVCVGGFSVEGTPGPVPIPVAKLDCADGTAIVGLWESKTPPTHQKLHNMCVGCASLLPWGISAHPTRFFMPSLFLFALECTPRARVGGYGLPHY